ncbi:MAG: hypothetical protein WCT12_33625 [Verrucomicrobiota bacterium]
MNSCELSPAAPPKPTPDPAALLASVIRFERVIAMDPSNAISSEAPQILAPGRSSTPRLSAQQKNL